MSHKLWLQSKEPPAPQALLAIESRQPLLGELMSFYIDDALVGTGVPVADLPLPDGAAVELIIRGNALVPPIPGTALQAGDHVHVIAAREDRAFIQLMFGRLNNEVY